MQENAIIPIKQHAASEIAELIEKTGQFRLLGFTFANIGKALEISESQAYRNFVKWAKVHEQEWKKNKTQYLVRINETYSKRLAEGEKNYLAALQKGTKQEAGFWSRHIIEILKEWANFFITCGYLNPRDTERLLEQKQEEKKEPIRIMIEEYRKILLTQITGGENESNTANLVTNP